MSDFLDPKVLITAEDCPSGTDYRIFGEMIALPMIRAEIREHRWSRRTLCKTEVVGATQMLMFLDNGVDDPGINVERIGQYLPNRMLGNIHILPAGLVLHSIVPEGKARALSCMFDADLVPDFSSICWSSDRLLDALDIRYPIVQSGMTRIACEVMKPGLAAQYLVEGTILMLVAEITRAFAGLTGPAQPASRLSRMELRAIMDRIDGERQAASLSDLARSCGFSRRHLIRAFKNTTGKTIGEYLLETRLIRSRRLLARRDIPIKEVAYRCGYGSAKSFSEAFRRATGQSPADYRRTFHRISDASTH